ncbi:MAG: HD domain-containing protein [Phycisphaerae bacterium]|nr:HD domain-containing protein [Phycisphaerae bacterium]
MPLLMPCAELKPGMRLVEPFIWHERLMIAADTVLDGSDIRSLQGRFPEERFRVADPDLDEVVEFEDDTHEREVAFAAQRRISECMTDVQTRFSTNATLGRAAMATIHSAVQDVIRFLEENPVSAALIENLMGNRGYLSQRAGNVFYLSMLLGTSSHQYVASERKRMSTARDLDTSMAKNLVPLGLGAMLLDLGMLPLEYLFEEPQPLTPEIWEQIRDHPIAGARMLPDDATAVVKMIVKTHHENFDGTGYPAGIPGEKLHIFTRIVRIADAFDAATSARVYRDGKSASRALWEMTIGPFKKYYDPELTKTFARLIQPFPIGSKIRLRNGQYAVVVKYNRENPFEPLVIVAFDSRNRRIPKRELVPPMRLGVHPDLRAASFCGEDLTFLYEPPAEDPKRSRIGVWPNLFEAAFP